MHYRFLCNLLIPSYLIVSLSDSPICQRPILVAQTVKNYERSEILALCATWQVSPSQFREWWQKTRDFWVRDKAVYYCTQQFLLSPDPSGTTQVLRWTPHIEGVYITAEEQESRKFPPSI